jgi:hypothetical protein
MVSGGLIVANFVWCNVYHCRIFVGEVNSFSFAYFFVNTIFGFMSEFSFVVFVIKGGYIMGMVRWIGDAGDGMDDYVIFVTLEG